jgi:hypothetical protein
MTPTQAVQLLDAMVALAPLSRAQHAQVLQALAVVRAAVAPKPEES